VGACGRLVCQVWNDLGCHWPGAARPTIKRTRSLWPRRFIARQVSRKAFGTGSSAGGRGVSGRRVTLIGIAKYAPKVAFFARLVCCLRFERAEGWLLWNVGTGCLSLFEVCRFSSRSTTHAIVPDSHVHCRRATQPGASLPRRPGTKILDHTLATNRATRSCVQLSRTKLRPKPCTGEGSDAKHDKHHH